MDPRGFTFGAGLGVAAFEFLVVGVVAWVLRRFWKSSFGPPVLPAAFFALTKLLAAQFSDPLGRAEGALISMIVGLAWWTILAWRDSRPRDKDSAGR